MRWRTLRHAVGAYLLAPTLVARAQDRGVAALDALVNGITVTPRVLVIGARPSDADADLIAWLARGHHVQTGFLSLERGESAPNYTGLESGATLGAIHVQEALAARRIDGGEQYFTRAYDFGAARTAAAAFRQWDHTTLLADVVAIVRSFRPQVIVALFPSDSSRADGQQQASAIIAREVFDAAADTVRFSTKGYGMPWSPSALYEPGLDITIDFRDYDAMLGRTYADVATESRAQLRSFGFATPPWVSRGAAGWHRVIARSLGADSLASSLFAGIDTSFTRLEAALPLENPAQHRALVTQVPGILAYADSARRILDLQRPATVIPYLQHVVELASAARILLRSCGHPARDAAASLSNTKCHPQWLDLDASLDLVQRRANDALLAASGVSVEALADREFLATGDSALVTIEITNNGDVPISVNDVSVSNAISARMTEAVVVPAHGSTQLTRNVQSMPYAHPWWIWKRTDNFYPYLTTALDGVPRPALFLRDFSIGAMAVPEGIRRLSDVTATLTLGRTTVTTSVGSVSFRTADPLLGVRDRALSGVPAVTLTFERALEWTQANKPLAKRVNLILRSYSDKPQRVSVKSPSTGGAVRVDSVPPVLILAPHESREVTVQLRGAAPAPKRYDLAFIGVSPRDTFDVGFRTAQYSYLAPMHFFRDANLSVQAVNAEIPRQLAVAYVRGAGDDADVALKGLGVPTYVLNNEGLTRMDLTAVSTVVIGPDAFRVDRGLLTQMPRLTDFARRGGTVLILGNAAFAGQQGVLPYAVSFAQPYADQVMMPNASVAPVDSRARVLSWPNIIRDEDWNGWIGARATGMPSLADSRYALVIETHDPGQKDNRNSILVASVGKGRVVYTSLALTEQISNAVPGAMRLFINLLCAGLPADGAKGGVQ